MDINHPRRVQQTAQSCLSAASYNPRRLVLIHAGAALACSFVLTAINFIVDRQLDATGGLSGIGLRSFLSTIQTVLQYVGNILMPFWQIGFVAAALAYARKQPVNFRTLLKGFQRFPSVIGLLATQLLIVIILGFACVYLATSVYMLTPMSQPLYDVLTPVMQDASILSGPELYLDDATLNVMSDSMVPLLVITMVVYALVMIPIFFRFRLAELILMDNERCGGLRALLTSFKLMRRNCIRLFKLDLRFWLFYVLQVLSLLLGYGDVILPLFGVSIPMEAEIAFFVFYLLNLVTQLALYVWIKPLMQTSYAVFYDNLLPGTNPPQQQPAPKNLPWDYS